MALRDSMAYLLENICKRPDQHSKWLYKMDRVHTLPCVVQPVNHERSRQQTAKVDLTWQQLEHRRISTFSGSVSPAFFLKATRTSCRRAERLFVCCRGHASVHTPAIIAERSNHHSDTLRLM